MTTRWFQWAALRTVLRLTMQADWPPHRHWRAAGAARMLDSLHAAGLQVDIPKLGSSLESLHQFGARARVQGSALPFTFTVPIDTLIAAAGSL